MLKINPDADRQLPDIAAAGVEVTAMPGSITTAAARALARALTGAVYISAGQEAARKPGGARRQSKRHSQ